MGSVCPCTIASQISAAPEGAGANIESAVETVILARPKNIALRLANLRHFDELPGTIDIAAIAP